MLFVLHETLLIMLKATPHITFKYLVEQKKILSNCIVEAYILYVFRDITGEVGCSEWQIHYNCEVLDSRLVLLIIKAGHDMLDEYNST